MPLEIDAKITLSDAELVRIAAYMSETQANVQTDTTPTERVLDDKFPSWRKLEERSGVSYRWPKNEEFYSTFTVYEGSNEHGTIRMAIGWCDRTSTWGHDRPYAITFFVTDGGKRPLCEFLATDQYESTGECVAIIRGAGLRQRSMFGPNDVLPGAYAGLRVENFRDHISFPGAWNKLAVIANKEDIDTMLNHSFVQAQLRFNINPS